MEITHSSDRNHHAWLRDDCHEFFIQKLQNVQRVGKRARMIRFSVNHAWTVKNRFPKAQFLEFGVHEGKDIARIAGFVRAKDSQSSTNDASIVYGFDSFEGLPEAWENGQKDGQGKTLFVAGKFGMEGKAPEMEVLKRSLKLAKHGEIEIEPNVRFQKGWFQDTVFPFFEHHSEPIAFIHADADLYGSTMTFLEEICRRQLLVKGSVICFDEFWNYESWQHGEYKAWSEIAETYNLQFEYLCFHAPGSEGKNNFWYGFQSVSVVISRDMDRRRAASSE
jgi:hypothetical protein